MLDNEFDQLFRDRLLNHSSRIKVSLWKGVHTHLLRHKTFHFWKWYIVGPSAVVVAITGHVIFGHPGHTSHKAPAAHAVATYESRPVGTAPASLDAPTTAGIAGSKTVTASSSTAKTKTSAAHHHRPVMHPDPLPAISPEQRTQTTDHRPRNRSAANNSSGLASVHHLTTITGNNVDAPRPPIPAQTTAQITIKKFKTPAIVAAKTPNPKTPHQLTLPSMSSRSSGKLHLDVFGSPEYFTFKSFGLSYGAGARVTLVFKEHFTLTTGFQYLRINANRLTTKDSVNGLLPGYFNNVHIPLLFGYTTGNRRYTFSANAGLIFSLYTQANGALKTTDNWPSHIGPNIYMGLNFSTHVTDRVSLFAEPYLKCWYPPGNLRLPSQLWSTGLMVGLRYNF